MRRALALLLALTIAVGCGSDDDPDDRLSLEPSTTTTTTPEAAALAALLPDEVREGFTRADDVIGAGPLDLDAAAEASPTPQEERALLERHGFRRGTSRSWVAPDGDAVYVAVYEFADDAGAAAYLEAQATDLADRGARPFDVPAGPARGFTTVEEQLTSQAVLLQRGARWALVLAASEQGRLAPADAIAVAEAVAARL